MSDDQECIKIIIKSSYDEDIYQKSKKKKMPN